jgi:hypothetical protein
MTETVKTLIAVLDQMTRDDLDQLDHDELKQLESELYNWQQLCQLRLDASLNRRV